MKMDKRKTKTVRGVFERDKGSDVWWIHYYANGRRHREKVGPKSLAIAAYQRRKSDIRSGKFFPEQIHPSAPIPFSELATDALEYSRQHHSLAGQIGTVNIVRALIEWFKNRPAEQITSQDIERKLSALADAGRKPATLNHYRSMLSLIFSLAIRNGKLDGNPARGVRRKIENNERVRYLEEIEEEALRTVIRDRCPEREPEFDLSLHTGMRRGEQYKLRWEDVDLERQMITIPISKHGKLRHIPINSVAREALTDLARLRKKGNPHVVPGRTRIRKKDQRRWFENAVEEAGLENFRWHDLRHTFASRLIEAGVHLRVVQELLGHRTIAMTLRYTHVANARLQDAVQTLASKPTPVIEMRPAARITQ
jgi:site-specific recombinase XerD